ncbi:hypothetical protein [Calothrix sp. PCC 6303]|uniref:hypothetical protein n=1 Tax=Calothrix sp. PCC 6303 TaxID=1170562 RepID=UPI0002A01966|nr:hypothetical protein [Calothrix sp. PCC 6303]AFZ01151.1 hypothetical protein Cal6303_2127 [Calothrix sp. PCC 6303]
MTNFQEFEAQYKNAMSETLDELQTAVLLLAQVQNKIYQIGTSVQHLSQSVEEFISNQDSQ